RSGERTICGVTMPDGLKENDPFPEPIVTPTTKSKIGHDIDVSESEIIRSGLIPADELAELRRFALQLYSFGYEKMKEKGLILADAKYEFGLNRHEILLIDEIHTPDSARYFYADGFEERQQSGSPQLQLSKEFVREWLMKQGFQGQEGKPVPTMPDEFVEEVSQKYIHLYETITGKSFVRHSYDNLAESIYEASLSELKRLGL
ncbi:MAG: phosphoribosylaminoimidazolesuccinocarboxamide synthase, partial [Bacteroidia bacterium]|nr:phosphoribosylaminoimidazolesuccinocarboxamide synthase [Bacteroidia bacterium]